MIGLGESGRVYESPDNDSSKYPPFGEVCDKDRDKFLMLFSIELKVNYNEADCNLLSDGKATLSTEVKGSPDGIILKTLRYSMQKPEGLQLLRQFDLTKEGWGSVTIDTLSLPEGGYPVEAVLTYFGGGSSLEKSASATLIVDRVPPAARMTYPNKPLMICPHRVSDSEGDWYGVSVEGAVTDDRSVRRYELYYGFGDDPVAWMPAMTRKFGEKMPIRVNGPQKRQTRRMDVTDLKGSGFSVKLRVVDGVWGM